jgi:hypothetical protein
LAQELKNLQDSLSLQHHLHVQEITSVHSKSISELQYEKANLESKLSNLSFDLNLSQQEHQLIVQRIKASYDSDRKNEIESLKNELHLLQVQSQHDALMKEEATHLKISGLEQFHQAELSRMQLQIQEQLKAIEVDYQRRMQRFVSSHEDEMKRLKEQVEHEIAAAHKQEIAILESHMREEHRQQLAEVEAKMQSKLHQEILSLQAKHSDELKQKLDDERKTRSNSLSIKHQEELEALEQKYAMQMKVMEKNYLDGKQDDIRHVHEEYREELARIHQQHDQELATVKALLEKVKDEYNEKERQYEMKSQEQVAKVNQESKIHHMMELMKIKEEQEHAQAMEVDKYKQQVNSLQQDLLAAHNLHMRDLDLKAQEIAALQQMILDAKKAHEQHEKDAVSNVQQEYERYVHSIQSQHQQEMEKHLANMSMEVSCLTEMLNNSRDKVKECESSLESISKFHALEFQQLRDNHLQEIESLKALYMKGIGEQQGKYEEELEKIKAAQRLESERLVLEKESENQVNQIKMNQKHEEEVSSLQAQHHHEMTTLRDILIEQQEKYRDLFQQYEQMQSSLNDYHKLKTDHHRGLETQRASFQRDIAGLQDQIATLNHERDKLKLDFQQLKTSSEEKVAISQEKTRRMEVDFIERERNYREELQAALATQQQELQAQYFQFLQQFVQSNMKLVDLQNSPGQPSSSIHEIQSKLLLKHLAHDDRLTSCSLTADSHQKFLRMFQKLPEEWMDSVSTIKKDVTSVSISYEESTINPLSSSASSPIERFLAAILEGDVQGLRVIVRAHGEDLRSSYWQSLCQSILPLHRAISGLHYHGSETLLLSTIITLHQLGVDVNLKDGQGNTALHKALRTCTSKGVVDVIRCLLERGADSNLLNQQQESPLHVECKHLRSASVEVIRTLCRYHANTNLVNESSCSPLMLVLIHAYEKQAQSSGSDKKKGGQRLWIQAAKLLVEHGAHWSPKHRHGDHAFNQVHLLLSLFPTSYSSSSTSQEDFLAYYALLVSLVEKGMCSLSDEDSTGRNAIFILSEKLATISRKHCPEYFPIKVMEYLLKKSDYALGGANHRGKTVFDIEDSIEDSCLAACRYLLRSSSLEERQYSHRYEKENKMIEEAKINSISIRGRSRRREDGSVSIAKRSDDYDISSEKLASLRDAKYI